MRAIYSLTFLGLWSHLTTPTAASGSTNPQEELDQARANWYFARNDGYYDFQYSESGLGISAEFPWRVEVRNGVVNRTIGADGNLLPPDSPETPTISTVFDFIQEAIDSNADTIRVTYNKTHGYPSRVFLDNDAEGRGDEYLVMITSVEQQLTYHVATEQAKLDEARNLWKSAALNAYTFQYNRYCFGCWFANYPWIVQVLEGQRARAIDSTGATVQEDYSLYNVDDVFDRIQTSLDAKAFEVHVAYSTVLGYPKRFFFNFDPNIMDDEFSIDISTMAAIGNPLAELALARERWETNSVSNYSYRLNKSNADPQLAYPWTIEIRDGFGVSITDANGVTTEDKDAPLLMESHLDTIESAFNLGTAEVEVTYSKPWGFPRKIHIDLGTGGDIEHLDISKFRSYRQVAGR